MANRFWVGGNADWDGTAGSKWAAVSGGAGGQTAPGSADIALFDAASGAVTVTRVVGAFGTTAGINFAGFTGTFAGTQDLICGTGGDAFFSAAMTLTWTGRLSLRPSGASVGDLTTNGKVLANLSLNPTGGTNVCRLLDNCTVTGEVNLATSADLNGFNLTASTLAIGNGSGTVTLGTGQLTLTGSGTVVTVSASSVSITPGSNPILFSYSGAATRTLSMASGVSTDLGPIAFSAGSGIITTVNTINCSPNFTGFTGTLAGNWRFSGTPTIVSGMAIDAAIGTLTLAGLSGGPYTFNSAGKTFNSLTVNAGNGAGGVNWNLTANLILSATATLIVTQGGFDAAGFDVECGLLKADNGITRALTMGSGDWNLKATSGTIINIATITTLTFVSGTGTIFVTGSTASTRTISVNAALALGDVEVNSGSGSMVVNAAIGGLNITSGFTGSLTGTMTIGKWLDIPAGASVDAAIGTMTFNAVSGPYTIDTAGKILNDVTFNGVGGSWQLFSSLDFTAETLTLTAGTLDLNGQAVNGGNFVSSGSGVRTLTMGASVVTLTPAASVNPWLVSGSNMTLTPGASQIVCNNTNVAATGSFSGGGKTYNNLLLKTQANAYSVLDSNTFSTLEIEAPATITFGDSSTQTVADFVVSGSSVSAVVDIGSVTPAVTHNLVKTGGGSIACDWLNIIDSQASPGSTWYAGANSVDSGNNTGWLFTVSPIEIDEALSPIDLMTGLPTFAKSIAETAAPSDSMVASQVFIDGLSESGTPVASVNATVNFGLTGVLESAPAVAAVNATMSNLVDIDESFSLSDVMTGGIASDVLLAESVAAADEINGDPVFPASIQETNPMIATMLGTAGRRGLLTNTLSAIDTIALNPTVFLGVLIEAGNAVASNSMTRRIVAPIAQSMSLSDVLAGSYILRPRIAEVVGLVDSQDAHRTTVAIVLQPLPATDRVTGHYQLAVAIAQVVGVVDSVRGVSSLPASITQTLNSVDIVGGGKLLLGAIAENALAEDHVANLLVALARIHQIELLQDSITSSSDLVAILNEVSASADTLAASISLTGVGTMTLTQRLRDTIILTLR